MKRNFLAALSLITLISSSPTQANTLLAPKFSHLGSYHRVISTSSKEAQIYFDQGMSLFYAFEWGEAVRSFKAAAALDPLCGMCHWGVSLGLLNIINAPLSGHEYRDAKTAYLSAKSLKAHETPEEQALIATLGTRFQHTPKMTQSAGVFSCHLSSSHHEEATKKEITDYIQAFQKIMQAYPDDMDAKNLYVYAIFDKIHWKFWDEKGKENPDTPSVIQTLQTVLKSDLNNLGANHYTIHVLEQSPQPADALPSADLFTRLATDSEHLVHMPAHIYFLTGRYHQGTAANLAATETFQRYIETCKAQGFQPEENYLYMHNYDFLRSTASMEGRQNTAYAAVRQIVSGPYPAWLLKEPVLQSFIAIPYFVEIRFAMWQNILEEKAPRAQYGYASGMWHFARGMAYSHLAQPTLANTESKALLAIISLGATQNNLSKSGVKLLQIGSNMLLAEIANRKGDEHAVILHLKKAADIQQGMGYHEPPDWFMPMQEALGFAYLHWHHPDQAIKAFALDLKQYPQNGWGLYGMMQGLQALHQEADAKEVSSQYQAAWKDAEIAAPINLFD